MLYRKDGQWELCPYKVVYTQHGEQLEQYTHDKQWWLDFEQKWEHTSIIEFIDVSLTDEEIARLVEIKSIPEGFETECEDYIRTGILPEDEWHPLKELQKKKIHEKLGQELSEREIQEIIQGIQLSDLEIRLLMGGM